MTTTLPTSWRGLPPTTRRAVARTADAYGLTADALWTRVVASLGGAS